MERAPQTGNSQQWHPPISTYATGRDEIVCGVNWAVDLIVRSHASRGLTLESIL